MVSLPPNSKIEMTFKQGSIGSSVGVDVGSCVSTFGYTSYSGLDFTFNQMTDNLPFQVGVNQSGNQRITACGSLAIDIAKNGSNIGFITFENLHDSIGPSGISQVSPQIVVRDINGKALGNYRPKELHQFDINNGKITSEISLNGSKLFYQEIVK